MGVGTRVGLAEEREGLRSGHKVIKSKNKWRKNKYSLNHEPCLCICVPHVQSTHRGSQGSIGFPGTGVADGCEPPYGAEN